MTRVLWADSISDRKRLKRVFTMPSVPVFLRYCDLRPGQQLYQYHACVLGPYRDVIPLKNLYAVVILVLDSANVLKQRLS